MPALGLAAWGGGAAPASDTYRLAGSQPHSPAARPLVVRSAVGGSGGAAHPQPLRGGVRPLRLFSSPAPHEAQYPPISHAG